MTQDKSPEMPKGFFPNPGVPKELWPYYWNWVNGGEQWAFEEAILTMLSLGWQPPEKVEKLVEALTFYSKNRTGHYDQCNEWGRSWCQQPITNGIDINYVWKPTNELLQDKGECADKAIAEFNASGKGEQCK